MYGNGSVMKVLVAALACRKVNKICIKWRPVVSISDENVP